MRNVAGFIKRYITKIRYKGQINGFGKIYLDKDYLKINRTAVLNLKGNLVLNANRMGKMIAHLFYAWMRTQSWTAQVSNLCMGLILSFSKMPTLSLVRTLL